MGFNNGPHAMTTLSELNSCDVATFTDRLRGIYEHSPWIPERAAAHRPFASETASSSSSKDAPAAIRRRRASFPNSSAHG